MVKAYGKMMLSVSPLKWPNINRKIYTATFKAGVKRTKAHQHLYLPKDYFGSPTTSLYTPWTEAEVLAHLTTGWGEGASTELKLEYLYVPEPEVSGEWHR